METPPIAPTPVRIPRKVSIGLVVGWILVALKCAFAPSLMARWQIPVDPGWVIGPTLVFAVLVTWLVITRDWSEED
jgi:hypothetical protein